MRGFRVFLLDIRAIIIDEMPFIIEVAQTNHNFLFSGLIYRF